MNIKVSDNNLIEIKISKPSNIPLELHCNIVEKSISNHKENVNFHYEEDLLFIFNNPQFTIERKPNEAEKRLNDEIEKQKAFEPITNGLKNVEEAVRKTDDDIKIFLVLVKPLTQTSDFITKQQNMIRNRDLETEIKNSIINNKIGVIAAHYLPKLSDDKFRIFHNHETNMHMVETDSLYHNNNKNTKKVKSSKGDKYMNLIRPIWNKISENKKLQTLHEGSGLINYVENPIQYKYIDNLNELLKRLYFIAAEEEAVNNNFHNEKLSIIDFVTKEMEKLIDTSKAIENLNSFVSSLPRKVIKGSGLVNDFLNNKVMPEIHWLSYNYFAPFTKSNKPINKLDEAAMEHDFYYEKHKDIKSRHKADLILENIAKDIYKNPETSLGEKTTAFATSNIMKVKRKLGMGLI
ncbi:Hypothetical protein CINCED_3A017106 [Cinara cedri]|uniref:Phospholipase A2-like domain-containing protein n=1 Tax=Cinara cedri TaxID=506608 RepID=A0A5E4NP47_9HEMI|nr:Hypothetical protein CINCED_3A017106 [Cinara cedri]